MNDTIYRQDAIDVVQKWFDRIELCGDICIDGLIMLPSAEPEIIYCKDCKYLDRHTDILKMHQTDGFCMEWARDTYENWYCSRAKRKTDGRFNQQTDDIR